jgi:lipid-A-disaccharide synthase
VGVHPLEAARLMAASDSGLVTSGTATLQAALAGMPHAVIYKVDPFTWWFALRVLKPLVMEKDVHLAIANVLAIEKEKEGGPIKELADAGFSIPCDECGRPLLVPELLQGAATPETLAEWLMRLRTEESLRQAMIRGFRQIRSMLEQPKDGRTAAGIVLDMLRNRAFAATRGAR